MITDKADMHDRHGNWQKYHNANPLQQALLGRFLDVVDALVLSSGPFSVADIGCAEGFVLQRLQQKLPEALCIGTDIDAGALRRARAADPSAQLQRMDVYDLGFRTASFDTVLCLEVLEHLNDPVRAIDELKRVARRHLVLSVPHEPYFRGSNLLRGKNVSRLGNDPEHVNNWNKPAFLALLRSCGLGVTAVNTPFPWLVVLASPHVERS